MQNTGLIEKIQNLPPETAVEVENFVDFLTERKNAARQKRSESLRAYAEKHAGTETDLDEDLEAAGIEHLIESGISKKEAAEQRAAFASFAEDWERPEMEVYDRL